MSKNSLNINTLDKDFIQSSLRDLIEEKYALLLSSNRGNKFFIEKYNMFEDLRSTKFLFHYLMDYNKQNPMERFVAYTLLKTLEQSEKIAAGSSFFTFLLFINFFHMSPEQISKFVEESTNILLEQNTPPTKGEFEDFRDKFFKNKPKWFYEIFKQATSLSGLKGAINLKPQSSNHLIAEVKSGYRFPIDIPRIYFNNKPKIELNEPKVCFVDGMIEKPSELFNILNGAHQNKTPLVLVAQKYSDEVLSTIASNFQRGAVQCYPLLIEPSVYTVNQIMDMAVACGSSVVSTLSGEYLIMKNFESLSTVDSISITDKEIVIQNPKTNSAVQMHIRQLLEKKSNAEKQYKAIEISDYNKLFDSRIEKLLGNIVEVKVPTSWPKQKQTDFMSDFDDSLRKIKSYYSHGLLPQQIVEQLKILPIYTQMITDNELLLPFFIGMKHAESLDKTFKSIDKLLTFL